MHDIQATEKQIRERLVQELKEQHPEVDWDAPANPGGAPQRFSGTPQEWDAYLSTIMADDVRLRFYQWIGTRAVTEAVQDVRRDMGDDPVPPEYRHYDQGYVEDLLDAVDPTCDGGPYPSGLPELP